jgi:hypothetical protein
MKMSAFGLAFSAVIRVCSSPAAARGSRSMLTPGYAVLNAAKNWSFVDWFNAEYTEIVPVTGAAVGAAVAVATAVVAVGEGVAAPPQAAATVTTPSPLRNVRRSSTGVILPLPSGPLEV